MVRQSGLYERWSREMRRSEWFRPGERVGVAVSGGADSILLLTFMNLFAREAGLTLAAVHFNHHLRGAESDADERFVREQAARLGIDWLRGEADVAREARRQRQNVEATARDLRYKFFFSLVHQGRVDQVVTAHTANDQAETVLLRILRGTGTRGLGGIFPALEGKIVRPFLNLTRAEIEPELQKRKLEWRLDSTNRDVRLRRNKVRMELLPFLQKEFNPEVIRLLKEFADRARDDEEYLEDQARERARPWRTREGLEERIPVRALVKLPPAVRWRVLRQMILGVRGNLRGITYRHVTALRHFLAESQSGRRLELPGGVEARKEYDWFILAPRVSEPSGAGFAIPVQVPGEVSLPQFGLNLKFKIIGPGDDPKAYNESQAVGLDPQKLPDPLVLRNWRAGDRYRKSGNGRTHSVKELLARRKVPLGRRNLWPVLTCGETIVWVWDFPPAYGMGAPAGSERLIVLVDKLKSDD